MSTDSGPAGGWLFFEKAIQEEFKMLAELQTCKL